MFPVPVLKLEIVSVYKSFFFNSMECWWKADRLPDFFFLCLCMTEEEMDRWKGRGDSEEKREL